VAENSPYFESIVASRAMLLNPDDYQGDHTLSLETQADIVAQNIVTYIHDHFNDFMKYIKYLSFEDQELLLSYYLLSKTQWSIARIHSSTQTICSFKLRLAMKKLGTYMLIGVPTIEKMDQILTLFGRTHFSETIKFSELIDSYAKTRSFTSVAIHFGVKRPDIRRAFSTLSRDLLKEKTAPMLALGAYIFGLIDKASAQGRGLSNRERAKICPIYRKDPAILGQFVVDVSKEEFNQVLVTKANY
jgi:hypothetical protein